MVSCEILAIVGGISCQSDFATGIILCILCIIRRSDFATEIIVPYIRIRPLQAAVGVVQQGLQPTIPKNTNPKLVELLERCW
ncbi:hypothetical protein Vadar_017353 [Vaccinium darrowii]|uniref:Uncharacterized protein n=1 Tax=Vaccinium darrowii TaxID=229202 RepID=A0ACB7Y7Z2_9ERIC|nr:hypothetical protein Vadar_017353 [Vaccinium darrowii]